MVRIKALLHEKERQRVGGLVSCSEGTPKRGNLETYCKLSGRQSEDGLLLYDSVMEVDYNLEEEILSTRVSTTTQCASDPILEQFSRFLSPLESLGCCKLSTYGILDSDREQDMSPQI